MYYNIGIHITISTIIYILKKYIYIFNPIIVCIYNHRYRVNLPTSAGITVAGEASKK